MPAIIPPRRERLAQAMGGSMSATRALTSQQDFCISNAAGQVAFRTGVLHQYPPVASRPVNYTSGYGWEVLQSGLSGAPVARGGIVTWTFGSQSPSTLAAAAAAGATEISSNENYYPGGGLSDPIVLDSGTGVAEGAVVTGGSGAGPYTLTLANPLLYAHASGATIGQQRQLVLTALVLYDQNGIPAQVLSQSGQLSMDADGNLQAQVPYASAGTVTLAAGAATVTDTNITSESIVRTFNIGGGGTPGALWVGLTAGSGFTVHSTSGSDTSQVRYEVVSYYPAPGGV